MMNHCFYGLGGRCEGRLVGVAIGTSDHTVWLHTSSTINQTIHSSHNISILMNGESEPVNLLRGCEKEWG